MASRQSIWLCASCPWTMGQLLLRYLAEIEATAANLVDAGDRLGPIGEALHRAVGELRKTTEWLLNASPLDTLAGATPYLSQFGIVAGGYYLGRLALAAHGRLAGDQTIRGSVPRSMPPTSTPSRSCPRLPEWEMPSRRDRRSVICDCRGHARLNRVVASCDGVTSAGSSCRSRRCSWTYEAISELGVGWSCRGNRDRRAAAQDTRSGRLSLSLSLLLVVEQAGRRLQKTMSLLNAVRLTDEASITSPSLPAASRTTRSLRFSRPPSPPSRSMASFSTRPG